MCIFVNACILIHNVILNNNSNNFDTVIVVVVIMMTMITIMMMMTVHDIFILKVQFYFVFLQSTHSIMNGLQHTSSCSKSPMQERTAHNMHTFKC